MKRLTEKTVETTLVVGVVAAVVAGIGSMVLVGWLIVLGIQFLSSLL